MAYQLTMMMMKTQGCQMRNVEENAMWLDQNGIHTRLTQSLSGLEEDSIGTPGSQRSCMILA